MMDSGPRTLPERTAARSKHVMLLLLNFMYRTKIIVITVNAIKY